MYKWQITINTVDGEQILALFETKEEAVNGLSLLEYKEILPNHTKYVKEITEDNFSRVIPSWDSLINTNKQEK